MVPGHRQGEASVVGRWPLSIYYRASFSSRLASRRANELSRAIPRPSFLSNARRHADTWPEIFTFKSKVLPYQHFGLSNLELVRPPSGPNDQLGLSNLELVSTPSSAHDQLGLSNLELVSIPPYAHDPSSYHDAQAETE